MAFEDIPVVRSADELMSSALTAGRKVRVQKKKDDTPLTHRRKKELERLTTISQVLIDNLRTIPKKFPDLDDLTEFYRELLRTEIDLDALRERLARVQNTTKIIRTVQTKTRGRLLAAQHMNDLKDATRQYIGRVNSAVQQLNDNLAWLEQVRVTLRKYPRIKQRYTVCIAGFPNVGKTTLLKALTGSNAEINEYAFTTKSLNLGYTKINHEQVQFIDTPGTLNRDHHNDIERQAILAQKYVADVIIYVWDDTQPYPLQDQEQLRKHTETYGAPIIDYLSKTDLLPENTTNSYKEKGVITQQQELLERLATIVKTNNDSLSQ